MIDDFVDHSTFVLFGELNYGEHQTIMLHWGAFRVTVGVLLLQYASCSQWQHSSAQVKSNLPPVSTGIAFGGAVSSLKEFSGGARIDVSQETATSTPPREPSKGPEVTPTSTNIFVHVHNNVISSSSTTHVAPAETEKLEPEVSVIELDNMKSVASSFFEGDVVPRIYGGEKVTNDTLYPFYTSSFRTGHLCGGVLIHADIVLTAANCKALDAFGNQVLVGAIDVIGSGGDREKIGVDRMMTHPDYKGKTNDYQDNIMLVKLKSLSTGPLAKINLDPAYPVDMAPVTAIGFGKPDDQKTFSRELLQVNLDTISFQQCKTLLQAGQASIQLDDKSQICAGVLAGGKDTCIGDSGGPLMDANKLIVGIISKGEDSKCGVKNVPSVYTRVSNYANWIHAGICNLSANRPERCNQPGGTNSPTMAPVKRAVPTNAPVRTPVQAPIQRPVETSPNAAPAPKDPVASSTIVPTLNATMTPTKSPIVTTTTQSVVPVKGKKGKRGKKGKKGKNVGKRGKKFGKKARKKGKKDGKKGRKGSKGPLVRVPLRPRPTTKIGVESTIENRNRNTGNGFFSEKEKESGNQEQVGGMKQGKKTGASSTSASNTKEWERDSRLFRLTRRKQRRRWRVGTWQR